MGYPIGLGGQKWGTPSAPGAKKFEKNIDPTRNTHPLVSGADFLAKKCSTWPQVGLQNRSKIDKKSMQKSIEKSMPLGADFWSDFGGFLVPKWSEVGTKMGSKIEAAAKAKKPTKH